MFAALVTTLMALAASPAAAGATPDDLKVPRYDHVFVIIEENKEYEQVMSPDSAPNLARLAQTYGTAAQFYSENHPSEANYVALLGGDTIGIHDDDAYYCKPGPSTDPYCAGSKGATYTDHTAYTPHLGDQLNAAGGSWKGYYESLPEPGSLAVVAGDPSATDGTKTAALYASKHSGFINFASVQNDPRRASHIVDFNQLNSDIAGNRLPNFALIVPNQCNEMHGLFGKDIPQDCSFSNIPGLIRRGDAHAAAIVEQLQGTRAWKSKKENVAIIITFDEGNGSTRLGCCGVTPGAASNFGGGHIPTIVITNHGPRGLKDDTPYSHYSMLRTFEDAFGLPQYLGHAAETENGVRPMAPLFAVVPGK